MPPPQYSVGDQVLIERETALRVDEKTDKDRVNNKLAPRTEGPFPVVALDEHTVTILRTTGLKDRVSRDRIVKAPSLWTEFTTSILPEVPIDLRTPITGDMFQHRQGFSLQCAKSFASKACSPQLITLKLMDKWRDSTAPWCPPSGTT